MGKITKSEAQGMFDLTKREVDKLEFTIEQYTSGSHRVTRHLVDEDDACALAESPEVVERKARRERTRAAKADEVISIKFPSSFR